MNVLRCGEGGVVDLMNDTGAGREILSLPVTLGMLESLEEKEVEKIDTDAYWRYVRGRSDEHHIFVKKTFRVPVNVVVENEKVIGFRKIPGVGIAT